MCGRVGLVPEEPCKCHPLGHWSTEKTLSAPVLVPVLTEALSCILQAAIEPAFSFVSIPYLPRRPTERRGDPFSHPSGSSALRRPISLDLNFEPKGAGRDCSRSRLPPARFSWSPVFYSCRPILGKPQSHWPRAQSRRVPGSRKLSVPGRVHSVPKSCGSQAALCAPGSNPLLTHDTVESPAKLFS